jgi:uncharacterized protein (DUF362 family)
MMIENLCPSVTVAKIDSRDYRDIESALAAAIEGPGGFERFVKPGMRVFLKPAGRNRSRTGRLWLLRPDTGCMDSQWE